MNLFQLLLAVVNGDQLARDQAIGILKEIHPDIW
jgi:hypothetical protein